jgi:hypothetical protein
VKEFVEFEELFEDDLFQYIRVGLVCLLSNDINLVDPLYFIDQTEQFLNFGFHFFTQNTLFPLKNPFQTLNQLIIKMLGPIILTHKQFHLMETVIGIRGVAHFQSQEKHLQNCLAQTAGFSQVEVEQCVEVSLRESGEAD